MALIKIISNTTDADTGLKFAYVCNEFHTDDRIQKIIFYFHKKFKKSSGTEVADTIISDNFFIEINNSIQVNDVDKEGNQKPGPVLIGEYDLYSKVMLKGFKFSLDNLVEAKFISKYGIIV